MTRYRDRPPLDQLIQRQLVRAERKEEGRCKDCGNFVDGKGIDGMQEVGTGFQDAETGEWRCVVCQALEDARNEQDGGQN